MIRTKIPEARRAYIKSIVADACYHFNKPKLPLEIKALVRSYSHIRLIPYSKHSQTMNIPSEVLISTAMDAYTDYYADINMYYIYYNNITSYIVKSNRYRWSIAHELGHVLLGHMIENDKTRIFRSSLSDLEYSILEEEADYFAQLILVPHAALIGFRVENSRSIRIMCKISEPASKRRFREYLEWKSHINANDEFDKRIFTYYFAFIFKRKCTHCGASLIQRHGKYCPICGKKDTLQWGDGNMIYDKLPASPGGKLLECPICKNEETVIDGNYCHICGANLINYCSNNNCKYSVEPLPTNARFCPICGWETAFYNSEFLKAWNYKEPTHKFNSILDDAFANVPDGTEEDEFELPFNVF